MAFCCTPICERKHQIKIESKYFERICSGKKTFEIRKNDRDYQVGDTLQFQVIAPDGSVEFTPNDVYRIEYITSYKQVRGYIVMSIARAL